MKNRIKNLLSNIPYSADLYDMIHKGRPHTRYNLDQLAKHLPIAVEQARPFIEKGKKGRKLLHFATLHYWVEQAAIIGLALRGMGHEVTVAYLPYHDWRKDISKFDLRRQDLYTRRVLSPLNGFVDCASLLDVEPAASIPSVLEQAVETASAFDAMYTLQVEDFDRESGLYRPHPVPDARGLAGTERILALARCADADTLVVCLLSGGASALLVAPADGLTLKDLIVTNELLLSSGVCIKDSNTVRKHLSKIKGGQLAVLAYPAPVLSLIVSDVIGDSLDVIASGPTVPDPTTFSEALAITKRFGMLRWLPRGVAET